jgi:transposase
VLAGDVVRFNGHKVRFWKHRDISGRIKSVNFAQDARGRWYCNPVCEIEIRPHGKNEAVGIDLGLKEGMMLSTRKKVENSRVFAKYEDDLATPQRANKARRVQAIHAKIVNTRKDFLHKETTKIADTFGLVCVGDISGRWLQATNGKSSADASTGMSRNMLRYKAIARGATFVDGIAGLEITEWECDACSIHHRDVNAARNHLRLGRQTLAEGSSTLSAQR